MRLVFDLLATLKLFYSISFNTLAIITDPNNVLYWIPSQLAHPNQIQLLLCLTKLTVFPTRNTTVLHVVSPIQNVHCMWSASILITWTLQDVTLVKIHHILTSRIMASNQLIIATGQVSCGHHEGKYNPGHFLPLSLEALWQAETVYGYH